MHSTMGWRVWSKRCGAQKWLLLACPLFVLVLMTITLPSPSLPVDVDRRSSRVLSSAGEFRSRRRVMEPPPDTDTDVRRHVTHLHRTQSASPAPADNNSTRREQQRSHTHAHRHKHRSRATAGAIQSPAHHQRPRLPQFIVNSTGPKHRIRPSDHSAVVKHTAQTHTALNPVHDQILISDRRPAGRQTDTNKINGSRTRVKLAEHQQTLAKQRKQAAKHSGKSDNVVQKQRPVRNPPRDLLLRKRQRLSKDSPAAKPREALSKPDKTHESSRCQSFPHDDDDDDDDDDHRRIRIDPHLQPLPWLSDDDIEKMELLAGGEVVSKARVPAHGQVLQVALGPPSHQQHSPPMRDSETHDEFCQRGRCALIKRTDDWFEVFSFHLDRVLGLNRSLPAVLRTLRSDVLPYRYISGTPRPVVWWDPDIQHLTDTDNDQNSVPLCWVQYQQQLQVRCGSERDLTLAPCVGIHHSEWGRLALFDFLLQVNDRLDRYCCGFTPDPTEMCVENLLHTKCHNSKQLLLVHILVRKADPSRLVFIDNSGRPQQSADNLNFRLVQGINEFPEKAVSVLQSGCLESLLLRSLYADREFWDSQGGVSGLRPLIRMVAQRGKILLQHIRDRNLQLKRDL
ncbi:Golgi-associated kinase 1A isoform X1 [Solea solea]|uniref:Golgi-associated kinase 1A isoform X1 n=2 Tax=Solea solea TaxID=90069 RepID=UPI00272A0D8A|nr:Golgi-associated kinase 1A isoform X1 [Solea solea]